MKFIGGSYLESTSFLRNEKESLYGDINNTELFLPVVVDHLDLTWENLKKTK